MKEQINEQDKIVVNEAVAKINNSLPYPKSLHVNQEANEVTYFLASGTIDESGGGSVHDVDYYTFPADSLNSIVLSSLNSEKKVGKTEVQAFRYTDYVDWPYGREDGREIHRDNEPVKLQLGFKQRNDMNVFVIAESETDIPPQIGTEGFIALLELNEYKKKLKYTYKSMVYSFLNDPVFPDFGNLNDLETPCKLVFDDYLTPETSSDGDYSEERRRILYFDKAMVIEALSKLKWGQKVEVMGPGRAIHFLEREGFGYNRNENTVELNLDNPVDVTMTVELTRTNHTCIKYNFYLKPFDSSIDLFLSKFVSIVC